MGVPWAPSWSSPLLRLLVTYPLGGDLHAGDSGRILREKGCWDQGRAEWGDSRCWGLGLTSNTCSSSRSSPSALGLPPLGTEITFSTVPASAGM